MVTREDVQDIALLSKLFVADEDLDSLTQEMANIIAFADTINNASEEITEEFDNINGLQNAFREDEVIPSYPQEEILRNVNGGEDGFFPVKKRK